VNVGIEKAVPAGVVHYYLASLDLADKKLELLSHLRTFASDIVLGSQTSGGPSIRLDSC
jgi:hypothetical protein